MCLCVCVQGWRLKRDLGVSKINETPTRGSNEFNWKVKTLKHESFISKPSLCWTLSLSDYLVIRLLIVVFSSAIITAMSWLSCRKCKVITARWALVCTPSHYALKACLCIDVLLKYTALGIFEEKKKVYNITLFFFTWKCCLSSPAVAIHLHLPRDWHGCDTDALLRLWCFLFFLWWKQQKNHLKLKTTTKPVTVRAVRVCAHACVCTPHGRSADTRRKHPQSVLIAQQYTKHRLQI